MYTWSIFDGALKQGLNTVVKGLDGAFTLSVDETGGGVFLEIGPSERFMWNRVPFGEIVGAEKFSALATRTDSVYWMWPYGGHNLTKIPSMTTWLMVACEDGTYTMIVPLPSATECHYIANHENQLMIYAEHGDPAVRPLGGLCAYIAHGDSVDELVAQGAKAVSKRIPTAKLRRTKKNPSILDKFGWCTWNAFYQDVSHEKVREGLESFRAAGVMPRYMILDDGWQQVEGTVQEGRHLAGFGTNDKFPGGLKSTVSMAKEEFGLDEFWVWHAVCGYWEGVSREKLSVYKPKETLRYAGRYTHLQSLFEWLQSYYVNVPAKKFKDLYKDYHAALCAEGVDGVKVDNQASLSYLGMGNGGRTKLLKTMRDALDTSTERHFKSNLISCMAHSPEIMYNCKYNNLTRGSDDFFPDNPLHQGDHILLNALNGLWFGEFMWLDWDMFTSNDEFANYHAAGRAVSGSPIYTADKPGEVNAEIIRKLVYSDGTTARCETPGRPTVDCMFEDMLNADVALKVYGTTATAVTMSLFDLHTDKPEHTVECALSPSDVPTLKGSKFAVWLHEKARCQVIEREDRVVVNLGQAKYDVATIAPVKYGCLAVFGLVNMFNASAAVLSIIKRVNENSYVISLRDGGTLGAWVKTLPQQVYLNGEVISFEWKDGLLVLNIADPGPCEVTLVL